MKVNMDVSYQTVANYLGDRGMHYFDSEEPYYITKESRFATIGRWLFVEFMKIDPCEISFNHKSDYREFGEVGRNDCECNCCTRAVPREVCMFSLTDIYGEAYLDWQGTTFVWTKKAIGKVYREHKAWLEKNDE